MLKSIAAVVGICLALSPTSLFASDQAEAFLRSISGQYVITLVGGHPPHTEDGQVSMADVFADKDEAALTMPYCPPGGGACDPGYLFFKYSDTEVASAKLPDGRVQTTLTVKDGAVKTYVWTQGPTEAVFRNEQYFPGVNPALEHVLKKN